MEHVRLAKPYLLMEYRCVDERNSVGYRKYIHLIPPLYTYYRYKYLLYVYLLSVILSNYRRKPRDSIEGIPKLCNVNDSGI